MDFFFWIIVLGCIELCFSGGIFFSRMFREWYTYGFVDFVLCNYLGGKIILVIKEV